MNATKSFIEILKRVTNRIYLSESYNGEDENELTFLLVENKKGHTVHITLPRKRDYEMTIKGVYLSAPIKPNLLSGSSIYIDGEQHISFLSYSDAIERIEKYEPHIPAFFSEKERQSVKYLSVDEAVNLHGNILNYKQYYTEYVDSKNI